MRGGEGALVVFATGDELKVLARHNFEEPIFATPAVSPDGILYVRTPSALYAVDSGEAPRDVDCPRHAPGGRAD